MICGLVYVATFAMLMTCVSCQLSGDDKQLILSYHETIRANAFGNVAETKLTWDNKLEQVAQNWANQCRWMHNAGRNADYVAQGGSGYIGENLAFYTYPSSYTPLDMLRSWANEKNDFTYPNGCAPGKICGHYTQMVWKSTSRIGCGLATCPSLAGIPYANTRLLVCNYAPAGNYISQPPY